MQLGRFRHMRQQQRDVAARLLLALGSAAGRSGAGSSPVQVQEALRRMMDTDPCTPGNSLGHNSVRDSRYNVC